MNAPVIWKKRPSPATVEAMCNQGLTHLMGIRLKTLGDDFLVAEMEVTPSLHQPMGLLHGGASVVLAETVGSVGGTLAAPEGYACVGQEINANHLRPVREGMITCTGRPVHIGGRSQVWEMHLHDAQGRLTCISRMTLAVVRDSSPNAPSHDAT